MPVSPERVASTSPAGSVGSKSRRRSKTAESRNSRAGSRTVKTERSKTKSSHRSRSRSRQPAAADWSKKHQRGDSRSRSRASGGKEKLRRECSRSQSSGGQKIRRSRSRRADSRSQASGGEKNPRRRRDPRRPVKGRSRRERSRTPASGGRKLQRRGDSREATPSAARTWSMARSCGGVSSVASESIKRQRGHEAHNYMSAHDVVRRLDQGTQAELRLVVAREKAQTRFKQFRWQWSPGAASGADDCDDEYSRVQQSLDANAWVHVSLPRRAPLMPGLSGFVHGIQHHNTSEDTRGRLLHPIRAWHSSKQCYYHMFKQDMLDPNVRSTLLIDKEFPDLFELQLRRQDSNPASGGRLTVQPMSDDNLNRLAEHMEFQEPVGASLLKHLFSFHEGEVRLIGNHHWEHIRDTDRTTLKKACFWRDQFMRKDSACQSRFQYLQAILLQIHSMGKCQCHGDANNIFMWQGVVY